MSDYDYNDQDEPSFLQKHRFVITGAIVLVIVGAVALVAFFFTGKIPPPRKPQEITISLPPPPPPPPLPPPPPPPPQPKTPPEQKMVEQTPPKPNEPKPSNVTHAPGPAGPKATGPASDDGLGGGSGGDGSIGGDGGGSRFGWYAGKIQDAVHQALSQNNQTSHASIHHLRVRIWIDSSGKVTRATISGSSGDPAVDNALKNEALVGVRLAEPPPSDMPMPVVMNIDEQRRQPN